MFKFLKNKIKDAVSKFTKSTEEEVEEITENLVEETKEDIKKETIVEVKEEKESISKPEKQPEPEVVVKEKKKEVVKEIVKEVVVEKEEPISESEPEPVVEESVVEKKPVESEPTPVVKEVVIEEVEVKEEVKEELVSEPLVEEQEEIIIEKEEKTISEEEKEYEEAGKKKSFLGKLFGRKEEKIEEVVEEPISEVVVEETKEEPISESEAILKDEVEDKVEDEVKEPVLEVVEEPEVLVEKKKEIARPDLLDEQVKDTTKQKKGIFKKIRESFVKFQLSEEKFEELFWDFELALMENNVAVEVIEKIKKDLHTQLTNENITRKSIEEVIIETLKKSLSEILDVPTFDLLKKIKSKKPYVICMVGVNGSGKTTTLAKLVHYFQKNNLSIVVAAADTFRAAAIQQLEEHTTKLGVKLIKHDYNADPAAVAFDAIKHATAKGLDVVLIDTAGRLQSNSNLMDELRKLVRVNKPDMNIFIGESITGNDCVEQAVAFNEAVGIDGIVLSKADVDEKGGAAISVSYVTGKPILYLGTGQTYDDLVPFNKDKILQNLGL